MEDDERRRKKRTVSPFNFHVATWSLTVVAVNVAAGGGERRSAGVRQLPATPTALSSDCKWQEGGAGAVGGAEEGGGATWYRKSRAINATTATRCLTTRLSGR